MKYENSSIFAMNLPPLLLPVVIQENFGFCWNISYQQKHWSLSVIEHLELTLNQDMHTINSIYHDN